MKYLVFYLLILSLLLCSCVSSDYKNSEEDKCSLLYFDDLLDGYYQNNYKYPTTIEDFIIFNNKLQLPEEYKKTTDYLMQNKSRIVFKQNNGNFFMFAGFRLIYFTSCRIPCNELLYDYNIANYINKILFFDKEGLVIPFESSEVLKNTFNNGIDDIKVCYKKKLKIDDTNKYVLLHYKQEEGLSYFCNEDVRLSDYEYFSKLEGFLDGFTFKYEISEIIFMTPVLYN